MEVSGGPTTAMTQHPKNYLDRGPWVPATADCYQTLAPSTLDLWRISLEQPAQIDILSEDELDRLNRYRFAADRRKFAVARSSLRQILARYMQTNPADLIFDYGPYGKPSLHNENSLQFNLSHSGEYALCGVATQVVGVDIEQLRSMERLDGLIKRCLAPTEQQALASVPSVQQSAGFLRYWTCKEAYLKATGQGISESLTAIEVELEPQPRLKGPQQPWQLQVFTPCKGYTAATVVPTGITHTRLWTYKTSL
ncbi:4 -phosphopantetheinyl transferase [Leptolyngbya sp. Heron Island J]|uniref:4'-phosphopantetheinyl transferase family protein n=1 Tax=Leptolyngbya sp. Heron Island J TaxID=1385935 RepID=UPI0003B9D9BA|nr:4'-phosphopantetheinyl transferase superfamily protein [Leptolyngbya sp. Heron Island J]ESA32273.1 4 -phosphopantetheinyl transferase [Leptolyngbya sp. Heron Island J]